jgi:hypothetical protein
VTGELTYHIRCDGCGSAYRPPTELVPAPKRLQSVRELAAKESWRHELVLVKQYMGPSPSLDFCPKCDDAARGEAIIRAIKGNGNA